MTAKCSARIAVDEASIHLSASCSIQPSLTPPSPHFLWPRVRQGSCKRPHQCRLMRSDSSLYHSLALTTDRWIALTHCRGRGRERGKHRRGWFSSFILFSRGAAA
ncbi:hypothetical protein ILYODFUR_028475 [Ilyodon furcidens]|uniref:Uncharacterized protein n=1 Tax=Ilyodon furcidens TaxID=33524 RepID=A0ABV0TYG6_9TELE